MVKMVRLEHFLFDNAGNSSDSCVDTEQPSPNLFLPIKNIDVECIVYCILYMYHRNDFCCVVEDENSVIVVAMIAVMMVIP